MKQVLIKLVQACWNIVEFPNKKFDEMLSILGNLFDHLESQAPTVESYDALTMQISMSFHIVFGRLPEVQTTARVALDARPSKARGGEGPSQKGQTIQSKDSLLHMDLQEED